MNATPEPATLADVATHLRAVLASVRAGELDAPDTYRARLEGAVLALDLGRAGARADRRPHPRGPGSPQGRWCPAG